MSHVDDLRDCANKIAEIYEDEVKSEGFDNGKLNAFNQAIMHIQSAIKMYPEE